MSYNISSKTLQDPLLKEILTKLNTYFYNQKIVFYVIGATARDIIMSIHNEKSYRATRDLDIAIAVQNWDKYKIVEKGILKITNFKKDKLQKQRFIYREVFQLDIVPFGDIMKHGDKIFWPPDETTAMSVLGFSEVGENLEEIIIDNKLKINVASLAGIYILKLVAWNDRNTKTNKDADDMAFIISNYLTINEKRAVDKFYTKIYLDEKFSINTGAAKLIGIDIAEILKSNLNAKAKLTQIIKNEIAKEGESILINQILETNTNFEYEETLICLQNIINEL